MFYLLLVDCVDVEPMDVEGWLYAYECVYILWQMYVQFSGIMYIHVAVLPLPTIHF